MIIRYILVIVIALFGCNNKYDFIFDTIRVVASSQDNDSYINDENSFNVSFRVEFWHANVKALLKSRFFYYPSRFHELSYQNPVRLPSSFSSSSVSSLSALDEPSLSNPDHMCMTIYLFCKNYKVEAVDCIKVLESFVSIVNNKHRGMLTQEEEMELRDCIELLLWAHQRAYVDDITTELTRLYWIQVAYENMHDSDPNYIVTKSHPTINVVTYLVAHEELEGAAADVVYQLRNPWAQIIRIHSTKFFESIIFSDHLPALQKEWEKVDYVVLTTYKSANLSHFNVQEVRRLVDVATTYDFDVIPLFRGYRQLLSGGISLHGEGFAEAWHILLRRMGYPFELVSKFASVPSFYRNSYLIRPSILKQLIVFMQKAMHIAETDPESRRLLAVNSEYYGRFEIATRIFSTYYFQMHPFIFERLPIFFMYAHNVSLCHGADIGVCEVNFPN